MPGPRRAFGAPCCAERSQQGAWVLRPAKGSVQGQKEKGVRSRAKGGQRSGEHEAARASLGGACAPGLLPRPSGPPAPPEVQAAGERVHGTEGGPGARGQGCTGWAIPSPWAGSAKPSHALHSGQRAPARDPRARLRTGAPPRADGREPPASRCERPRPREATHTGALSCWRRTSRRLRSQGAVRPGPASLAAPRPLCRPAEDLQADPGPTQFLCNLAGQAEGAGNHTESLP